MYNTASFFTLGFTKFNMYMSLLMIVLAVWFIAANYKKLTLSLKAELEKRFSRLFAGINRQPLYKVFYGFDHKNTASWVNWIKTQNLRQQERAFARLADYLQEPPKELGLITLEVVRAVIAFEHTSSYEVLTQLLTNSRIKWGQYKALNCFYEEAAIGIMKLDEALAKKFLLDELSIIKNNPEVDSIKDSILAALTHLTNKIDLVETFNDICLDSQHSFYIRSKAISTIKENCSDDELLSCLNSILLKFLSKEDFNFNNDDLDVYSLALRHTLAFFTQEKYSDEIWELWCQALAHKVLNSITAQTLSTKIKSSDFIISTDKLSHLLKSYPELKNIFSDALAHRFNLSNEELTLVKETEQNQEILSKYKYRDTIIKIYEQNITHDLPEILESNYNNLAVQTRKLKKQMLLITGRAEVEKLYLAELLAKELKRTFIYINGAMLMLSPDQMDQTLSHIKDNQNYLIYVENIFKMLNNPNDNLPNNNRLKKFNEVIYKLQSHPKIIILASIPMDLVDLYDNHPEIVTQIQSFPNDQFKANIDIGTASARFKQKVYAHYEVKLQDDRDTSAFRFDELIYKTEDLSSVEFLDYFLDYLRTSLLTEGKLLPIGDSDYKGDKQLV